MELNKLFCNNNYRDIFFGIISYLNFNDIQNLSCLNKESNKYLKDFIQSNKNQNIIRTIFLGRYFEKQEASFFIYEKCSGPSSTISHDKSFWRDYYPNIDHGDIIYIKFSDKFVKISTPNIYIRHQIDDKIIAPTFPIDYWKTIGVHYSFRLWIVAKVFNDTLEHWKNNPNIQIMENPKVESNPTEICVTYVNDMIYIYFNL